MTQQSPGQSGGGEKRIYLHLREPQAVHWFDFHGRSTVLGGAVGPTLAMNNLLTLIDDNREIALESESQDMKGLEYKLDQAIARGKIIIQSRLSSAIGSALPNIDSFVDTVDNIVQVRQD